MSEKYQESLEKLKNDTNKITESKAIQGIFELEDSIKFLKANATTEEQLQRVNILESQLQKQKEELNVSDFQNTKQVVPSDT
jgi:hypothetical protein|nr:MAG TPA: hypothetical protein [Caudoviricetes sp.]